MHNTRRIYAITKQKSSPATNPLPRIFVAFRRNDSGPDERKMATSVPHSDISLAPSLHRGVPPSNAFMRECAFALRFPLLLLLFFSFYFISFFFGWTSIYSPATRASNMNLLALVFLRDDRYSVRHRVKYESHRELETNVLKSGIQRPPLFRLFSNVRTPRSA